MMGRLPPLLPLARATVASLLLLAAAGAAADVPQALAVLGFELVDEQPDPQHQ